MDKRIEIRQMPLRYKFIKNNMEFTCEMTWRDEKQVDVVNALIADLEECILQLKQVPQFKVEKPFELPPMRPEDENV